MIANYIKLITSRRLFFSMTLCTLLAYIDNDSAVTFYPEATAELRQIKWSGKAFRDPVRNPSASLVTINKNILLKSRFYLISFSTRAMYRTWSQHLLSLNDATARKCISNQCTRTTFQQPRTNVYPVFFPLRQISTKKKRLHVSFAFFQQNYLPNRRVNKIFAAIEELTGLRDPEAMDGVPPFVMNSNCI